MNVLIPFRLAEDYEVRDLEVDFETLPPPGSFVTLPAEVTGFNEAVDVVIAGYEWRVRLDEQTGKLLGVVRVKRSL